MKRKKLTAVIALGLGLVATGMSMVTTRPQLPPAVSLDKIDITTVQDASSTANGEWLGLCPKDSVRSVKDLYSAIMGDPALTVYYQGFRWSEAQAGVLPEPTLATVSHRKGYTILPSTKKILLPKGDPFVTDGKTVIRMHCCNRAIIEDFPELPPAVTVIPPTLSVPVPPPASWVTQYYPTSSGWGPYMGYPGGGYYYGVPSREGYPGPGIPPVIDYPGEVIPPISDNPGTPPTSPVPEPATMLLFGAGLILIFARRLKCLIM